MVCKVEYSLADITSDGINNYQEYDYTDEKLREIFAKIHTEKKNDFAKLEYLKAGMPNEEEVKMIVQDIIAYYSNNFEIDEMEIPLTVSFYVHKSFKEIVAYAIGNTVRISVKELINEINRCLPGRDFDKKVEDYINLCHLDWRTWFQNKIRVILAHEMYHIFHAHHYMKVNQVNCWSNGSMVSDILKEVFAEYFAYSYFRQYLERTVTEEGQLSRENRINTYWNVTIRRDMIKEMRLFGIGRKILLRDRYSEEEVNHDTEEYTALKENPATGEFIARNMDGLSIADYAGGYLLWYVTKINNEAQGKDAKLYKFSYTNMIEGKEEDALHELIDCAEKLKEKGKM